MRKSRKREIYETAMELFQERGYEAVTVLDICEACGITKKAFYYHYASKEELLALFYSVLCDDFDWEALKREEALSETNYLDLLWKQESYIIDASIKLGVSMGNALHQYDYRLHLNIYSPFIEGPYSIEPSQKEYLSMVERGQQAGQIRADRSAKELLFVLFSSVIGLGSHWRSTGGAYDLKAEVRKIFDFVMLPPRTESNKEGVSG